MKFLKDLYLTARPFPEILIIFFLLTYFYISYTSPGDIYYNQTGILYQQGNPAVTETINIIIEGKYRKSLFGNEDEFVGTIDLGDETVLNSLRLYDSNKTQKVHITGMNGTYRLPVPVERKPFKYLIDLCGKIWEMSSR
jgi:hypothetical protein